jgi:PrtD family type I secretion system ABC transporter
MAATNSERSESVAADSVDPLGDLLRAAKGAFIAAVVFSFIVNMTILVMPFYMYNVFRRVIPTSSHDTLWLLVMVVIWVLVIQVVIDCARTLLLEKVARWIDLQVGHRLFEMSIRRSVPRGSSGDMSLLNRLNSLRSFISSPLIFAAMDAVWVPIFICVLFFMNYYIGLTALVVVLIAIGLGIGKKLSTDRLLLQASRAASNASVLADTAIKNADTTEVLGMTGRVIKGWSESNDLANDLRAKASRRSGIFQALIKLTRIGSIAAVMTVAMLLMFSPEAKMAPGMMMASMILVTRCVQPLELLISSWDTLGDSFTTLKFLRETLQSDRKSWKEVVTPVAPEGKLDVIGVVYQPANASRVILNRVSFSLAPGESLAVVGPTASGKSSLARLLIGIEAPTGGDVRLDGTMLHSWDTCDRGRHIGYLPQSVELMDGTVFDNVSRFNPEASEEEVWQAIDLAGTRDLVSGMTKGLLTPVGASGNFLSGGQKQRIGLARALFGDVKLVVLDEPNANLDDSGEKALSETLSRLKEKGTTVVVILHRPNVLAVVDYIMVMRDGGIQKLAARDEMLPLIGAISQQVGEVAKPFNKIASSQEPQRVGATS